MVAHRWFTPTLAVFASALLAVCAACSGDNGEAGTSCSVMEDGSGGATIVCDDGTSVSVPGGEDGANCTVADDGAGTKTITCDDGTTVTVADGVDVDAATVDEILARLDEASNVAPESCNTCHRHEGEAHQAIYNDYADDSDLTLEIDNVSVTGSGSSWTVVLTISIMKDLLPFIDADRLPRMPQKTFYTALYNATDMTFDTGTSLISSGGSNIVALGDGQYRITKTGVPFNPMTSDAHIYGYIADELLDTESGGHVHMYDNVASVAVTYGDATTTLYDSPANVTGCERCHGEPYMKHGYRDPRVEGLGDFASCKSCHYDTRNGGHPDWQLLQNEPSRYAELDALAKAAAATGDSAHDSIRENMTAEELAQYGYIANLMNDVHMAHAMEFPYPTTMSNCVTCHDGKLDEIQTVENYVKGTCLSCHAWTGEAEYGTAAHSLETIWENSGLTAVHASAATTSCNTSGCHDELGTAKTDLTDLHNGGYNEIIYSEGGAERYSEVFTVTIESASFTASTNMLNVKFNATEAGGAGTVADWDAEDIVPTLMIGLYGYDTKDFIVAAHGRDDDGNRLLEFEFGGTNPRFTVVTETGGAWEVNVDLSMWAGMLTDDIIRRAEISVLPALTTVVGGVDDNVGTCDPTCGRGTHCTAANACEANDDWLLALNAPSETFDFAANDFDDDFYVDIVDEAKCNECHDALASTFHSGNRGGNIRVCRTCHVGLSGGSHLEMQSRSIDSYVHAIHSFQAFDPGDIDFDDAVEALRYEHHIEHVFPNFTVKNCEACHNPGMYNPPDQSRSMPGRLSKSDDVADRNIGDVPAMVTGPGARACGACHRAHLINEDDAAGLAAFYQHTTINGYMLEDEDGVLDTVIDTIMSIFE